MMCVVIVDDDKQMQGVYKLYFENDSLDWEVFENGYQALEFLEQNRNVEAVLLDLCLKIMDGLTLSDEIRKNENLRVEAPPVKMAFYTSYEKTPAIEQVIEQNNVEKYFRKPIDVPVLIENVKEWLNR